MFDKENILNKEQLAALSTLPDLAEAMAVIASTGGALSDRNMLEAMGSLQETFDYNALAVFPGLSDHEVDALKTAWVELKMSSPLEEDL